MRSRALLLAVALSGCTLGTFPRTVEVRVAFPPAAPAKGRYSRQGPELVDMKCYGLVVNGAPGAVSSTQTADRSPQCLGLNGAFFGPYTYSQITTGVSLSLAASAYTFSVVGFHGIPDCGNGPSTVYNSSAAQTFAVAPAVSVDLASQSKVTLSAASYTPATAADRTPLCPPAALECSGAEACDRFAEAFTPLVAHVMDVGGGWTLLNAGYTDIYILNYSPLAEFSNGPRSYITTLTQSRDQTIRLHAKLGRGSENMTMGILARYADTNNYTMAVVERVDLLSICRLRVYEMVAGVFQAISTQTMTFPDDCPTNAYQDITFSALGTLYLMNYRGYDLPGVNADPALVGVGAGMSTEYSGAPIDVPYVNFFRVDN